MHGRIVDAILVARDLVAHYPEIVANRLDPHPAGPEGDAARRGVAITHPQGSTTILEAVRDRAAKMRGLEKFQIDIIPVPAKIVGIVQTEEGQIRSGDRIMRSLLLRYGNRAIIKYVDNLNECWQRFVICKELAHLVMGDDQGERATSVAEQIAMAYAICNDVKPEQELSGEQFAWFVAAELMLPHADRLELSKRKELGEATISIARSYWTPVAILNLLFDTQYGNISRETV